MNESNVKNEWIEWGKAIIITVLFAIFIQGFIVSTSIVEGESMEPTLGDGSRIVFNKLAYIIGKPEREDVVIINRTHKNYVKRIVALPEETIEVRNHVLYIDDKPYEQTYLMEQAIKRTGNFGPISIPEDNYFVMGDNRAISYDSRRLEFGFIKEANIIGRSELIIYPFSDWSMIK